LLHPALALAPDGRFALLGGAERGPKRDAVLLNAAAALFVAGGARTLLAGWELADGVLNSGQALRKLEELRS